MSLLYHTPDLNLPTGSDAEAVVDINDWVSDFGDSDVPDLNLPNGSEAVDSVMDFNINDSDLEWEGIGGEIEALLALIGGEDENHVLPSASNAVVENLDSVGITQQDVDINDWVSDVPDLNLPNGSEAVDSVMEDFNINDLDLEWEGIGDVIGGEIEVLLALIGGEDENYVLPSASNAVVENLDSVLITQQDVDNDKVTCAVCTDDMNVGDMAKQLPCFHRYHGHCILPWLTRLELT